MMKALSLFANIGVAEAYLDDIGVSVVLANEIDKKRSTVYSQIYPNTEMICGDITDEGIRSNIIKKSKEYEIDVIIATPPCQGMSTAGKQNEFDMRNQLIHYPVDIINRVKPRYAMIENVPMQLQTEIYYNENRILIPDYINYQLGDGYFIEKKVINTSDYGVPQTRERAIFLLTRKDIDKLWLFPEKAPNITVLEDAIGHLPQLDPLVYDIPYIEHLKIFPKYEERKEDALKISKWHTPPRHVKRQVEVMLRTPTGQTAFNNNNKYLPRKENGEVVKGYKNTYKRQSWDMPAYTITMYNRTISSQNNVHPGRFIGKDEDGYDLYSDPRVLTVYELMLCMSLPSNWNLPDNVTEHFIRSVIGEGIPPLFVKKIFEQIL